MKGKQLYRSKHNKIFAGIIRGVGEYFDIDPALLRVIWFAVLVFTGFVPGLLIYLAAFFVVPKET